MLITGDSASAHAGLRLLDPDYDGRPTALCRKLSRGKVMPLTVKERLSLIGQLTQRQSRSFWGVYNNLVETRVSFVEIHQLDLFADNLISKSVSRQKSLSMDAEALVQWKTRIAAHQQRAKENQLEQGTLFDVAKAHVDSDKIDPFHLCPCPMSFYRLPTDSLGEACQG